MMKKLAFVNFVICMVACIGGIVLYLADPLDWSHVHTIMFCGGAIAGVGSFGAWLASDLM